MDGSPAHGESLPKERDAAEPQENAVAALVAFLDNVRHIGDERRRARKHSEGPMTGRYHLYFDDSGSRDPDSIAVGRGAGRGDQMDCFALGGILVDERDIDVIFRKHKSFCDAQGVTYPLHSTKIRGGRGNFGWLKNPEKAAAFLPRLEAFILELPIIALACVINRPGYVSRYKERYRERLWLMCKTACSILIERAAKFADENGCKLEIYFESSGKKEDRDIVTYVRALKREGAPFSEPASKSYEPLRAEDYQRIVLGEPHRKTKRVPMIQIADLVLYPLIKSRYDPGYRPYAKLSRAGKLIDNFLRAPDIPSKGIKYSCFEG